MITATSHRTPRLCPFSVYDYLCDKDDCQDCPIHIEAQAKANESKDPREYEPSYQHLKNILGVK